MTDFDHASLDRVLPPIQGAPDWADVLSRSRARHGRHRRHLILAAAAALVAVIGTATAIGGVRAFVLDKGFIGLPPRGATPSGPESGELVLRWEGNSASHAWPEWRGGDVRPYAGAWVYADGRMIWWRDRQVSEGANELTTGYLEQRLTPQGVELLRSEVVGLLDHSRALLETVPPDDDPWPRSPWPPRGLTLFVPQDYGSHWGSVDARDGDEFVRLYWSSVAGKRSGPWKAGPIATPEQLSDLRRIDALLTDPTSVLPSSAWAVREVGAYVPSHYAVCITSFGPPKDVSYLMSLLPTQAADVLRDNRARVDELPEHVRALGVPYCSKLTTEEAREVADAVSGLERDQTFAPYSLVYRVAEGVNDGEETTISFDPYLPDGRFLYYGGPR